jgi:hypothetical protein
MDSEKRIQAIVKTFGTGPDRIPLRRALRFCLSHLDALRAQGLTWGVIAMRMTKAGARHRRGQAISEHQLRTEYGRLTMERNESAIPAINVRKVQPLREESPDAGNHLQARSARKDATTPGSSRLADILKTRVRRVDLDD